MNIAFDILETVQQYLDAQLDLYQLENWLAHHLDELLSEPGTTPYELAAAIELGLAELSANDIDEHQFRSDIESFLADRTLILRLGGVREFTAATDDTIPSFGAHVTMGATPEWSRGSRLLVAASS